MSQPFTIKPFLVYQKGFSTYKPKPVLRILYCNTILLRPASSTA